MSVHPRRRGEHLNRVQYAAAVHGSSPQARGTRDARHIVVHSRRFIPAGAGNTCSPVSRNVRRSVHPRRRGEHPCSSADRPRVSGSSPQARGTPGHSQTGTQIHRFIPAGAGNTTSSIENPRLAPVHPRRRGEHSGTASSLPDSTGSSPQARGTRGAYAGQRAVERFIPAGAGNTIQIVQNKSDRPVHPRRRGEHANMPAMKCGFGGSSPQARGTRDQVAERRDKSRFIPAGAGNTWPGRCYARMAPVHPRAGAGNTRSLVSLLYVSTVHPRRRGEHCSRVSPRLRRIGSSPQARGTPAIRVTSPYVVRFIPAGAGNTASSGSRL